MGDPQLPSPSPEDRRIDWPAPTSSVEDDDFIRWTMKVLAIVGMALVVIGAVVAFRSNALSYPSAMRDYICGGNHASELVPGSLWLVWFVLVAVATVAVRLWRHSLRGDRYCKRLAILGLWSAILLFPGWIVVSTVFDCGL